jgi:mannose-6-phosphate isomerase-like protein (cupin superfamily)
MKVTELEEPRLIRWTELAPRWVVPHSKEAGYLRFNVSYVGGPPGFVNIHPETGLISSRTAIGLMWMPAGQRQFGLHRHTVAESYVILQGTVESIEPTAAAAEHAGEDHLAGTLDLMHMPAGSPHASRTVGAEDVMLLWFHDGVEREDAAIYYEEDDPELAGMPLAQVVKADALAPSWDDPGAREAGTMRMATSYIGGPDGFLNYNRGQAVVSDRNAAGLIEIPPGNAEAPRTYGSPRYCIVASGTAAVVGHPELPFAEKWDMLVLPQTGAYAIRTVGIEPLRMISILEDPEPVSGAG